MMTESDILHARILIVDDTKVNVQLMERILAMAGYTSVQSTSDPQEVCLLHREHRYDLIVLDLVMPGMDGFQVMQALQQMETGALLPVLVLSAQPEHKRRALAAGARDFLGKPFQLPEFQACVHKMLAANSAKMTD